MINLNNLTLEIKAKQQDRLREAQMQRLINEAQQGKARSRSWMRIITAVLLLRPF